MVHLIDKNLFKESKPIHCQHADRKRQCGMNGKKRRSESPVTGPKTSGLTHYSFRLETYPAIVPYNELAGCKTITHTLEREIRTVLLNESLYETCLGGRMPVNRFLRFCGVKSSSKETAVLSFAADCKLDVLLVRSPSGFEPEKHLKQIYKQAKELHVPVLIVLKDLDVLFRYDKEFSAGENYKRTLNTYALVDELQQIRDSHWKIWTLILSTTREGLPFEITPFFENSTTWAGLLEHGDIFDDVTRAKIIMDCLKKYIPQGGSFPFDGNATALMDFAGQFTQYCTYRQIEEFVRTIVNQWKYQIPQGELLLVNSGDTRLIPMTKDFINAVRGRQNISAYPAYEKNCAPFLVFN
jgi:hypothetical protein